MMRPAGGQLRAHVRSRTREGSGLVSTCVSMTVTGQGPVARPHLLFQLLEHDIARGTVHLVKRLLLKHPDRDELRKRGGCDPGFGMEGSARADRSLLLWAAPYLLCCLVGCAENAPKAYLEGLEISPRGEFSGCHRGRRRLAEGWRRGERAVGRAGVDRVVGRQGRAGKQGGRGRKHAETGLPEPCSRKRKGLRGSTTLMV